MSARKSRAMVYVAHKIRDPRGPYWMAQHIAEAERVALAIWALGAAVICPGKNTQWFDGALPDSTWLDGDLEIVRRCDCVVMSPNWPTSEGAKKERQFAIDHNIPVFEYDKDWDRIVQFVNLLT